MIATRSFLSGKNSEKCGFRNICTQSDYGQDYSEISTSSIAKSTQINEVCHSKDS